MDFDGPSLITLWPNGMNLLISFHVYVCVMSSQYNHNTKNLTYLIAHQTHTHTHTEAFLGPWIFPLYSHAVLFLLLLGH